VKLLLSKRTAILAILLGATVSLIGWSQNWLTLKLASADIRVSSLDATGQSLTALPAGLALVALSTGLVILTSRAILAYVIAAINAAAGIAIVAVCVAFGADPVSFAFKQLTALSGIADDSALRHLVSSMTVGFGVFVCAVGGFFILLGALVVAISAHAWPHKRTRYERANNVSDSKASNSSVETLDAWDEMSRGRDPTN
jgi:uncharacterized membrane protein (TIGR02234 family)